MANGEWGIETEKNVHYKNYYLCVKISSVKQAAVVCVAFDTSVLLFGNLTPFKP